jgi:uncharacterized protein (DUF362 family)
MTVSLVKYDGSRESLRRAIELCDGLRGLRHNDRVLIKPNYGFRHKAMPPFGTVTTTTVLAGIIGLLREQGCTDITVGEGAIAGILGELDLYWKRGFRGTGVEKVAERHGARLVDFNEGPFEDVDLDGVQVEVSRHALETDFLVNVPVLKTHSQMKVSLGFKNLKGCLSQPSKKKLHSSRRLGPLVCRLNEVIRSDLVVVDGIYMLEKGPDTLVGEAHRKDLIVAGKDVFECDAVAANVLGIDPSQLEYLVEFAQRHDRSLDIDSIRIEGEDIETLKEHLEWEPDIGEDVFSPQRIRGLRMPHPGNALCSGCYATLTCTLLILSKERPDLDFSGAEICMGPELRPGRYPKTAFLCGNCAVKANRDLPNAVRIEGCPPSLVPCLLAFMRSLLSRPQMLRTASVLGAKLAGMKLGIHTETFPKWERYRSVEFDRRDF